MKLHARLEHMWWNRQSAPRLLLWAGRMYARLNQYNLQRRAENCHAPPLPMISVGNITVGGSGKTPFVIWLATALRARGITPIVLCRGDGGRLSEPRIVTESDPAEMIGDEARLLFEFCGCTVITGRDRVAASYLAANRGDVILLDDGFQYRQLARICDIVLVPASGTGNGAMLPAGPLREPVGSLARADIIVRTGEGKAVPLTSMQEWRWYAEPGQLVQVGGWQSPTPEKVFAACAIARPWRFLQALENSGLEVSRHHTFPDHHRFSDRDVEQLAGHGLPVAVTGKDAVKLRPLWTTHVPLWVLEQQIKAPEGLLGQIVGHILAGQTAGHGTGGPPK